MSFALLSMTAVDTLERGQSAIVEEISGSAEFVGRMSSLGVCPGCLLECLEPGSPCCLAVGESRIVLRGEQAASVRVSPLS